MIKKISSIILIIAILFASTSAIDCDATDLTTHNSARFSFLNPTDKTTLTSTYHYSDSYFDQSSLEYNPKLATMSMCMACATTAGTDVKSYSAEIESVLAQTGFGSIYVNDAFNQPGTRDSIGYVFGYKEVYEGDNKVPLVAVNFRNSKYGKEWSSNLNLGTDTDHAGFQAAGDLVLDDLADYLNKHNITDRAKLWIVGYSRGAGIANYIAAKISKSHSLGETMFSQSDVYAYTFATPNITTGTDYKKSTYKNIFNIVSKYDIIASIAPEQWNWHRYGQTKYLPNKFSDSDFATQKQKAQNYLNKYAKNLNVTMDTLPGYTVNTASGGFDIVPNGTQKDTATLIDDFLSAITGGIGSNANYNELKPTIDAIVDVVIDSTDEEIAAFKDAILTRLNDKGMITIMADLAYNGELTTNILFDSLEEAGIAPENAEELKPNTQILVKCLGTSIVSDFSNMLPNLLTIFMNSGEFFGNHYYINYLAWLQSMDPNYAEVPTVTQSPTTAPVKLSKAKITKAKKQSSKKVKVILKKVKNATGYKFQFYKAKTTKAKKRVYTKTISKNKTTFTFKSKKFKTKKLYVRARAYSKKVSPTVYGSWSKLVKVKK